MAHDRAVSDLYDLCRFVDAQKAVFPIAIDELSAGSKRSHWMWFIFPQLVGLGRSETAQYYGISSLAEASAYLAHPLLGPRLRQSLGALLDWAGRRTAEQILGPVDSLKLRSSLTLFDLAEPRGPFRDGLAAFFGGACDERTLALLNAQA